MNGLDFLNLVIGLIFIYLIYSIACSTLWEIIINLIHLRGRMLYNWLKLNFSESNMFDHIAQHALVKGMMRPRKCFMKRRKPSYISSEVFTDVLMDIIVNTDKDKPLTFNINTFRNKLESTELLDSQLKRIFLQYLDESSGNLQALKDKIGKWFDETQERLIGTFKKKVQVWIFLVALVLVGATNADTFTLAGYLYTNDDAREALADQAVDFVKDTASLSKIRAIDTLAIDSASRREQQELINTINENIDALKELDKDLKENELPLGWKKKDLSELKSWEALLKKLGGLLLTVFAVSMGSPFWFDILSKLANLRSSGNKPKSLLDTEEKK